MLSIPTLSSCSSLDPCPGKLAWSSRWVSITGRVDPSSSCGIGSKEHTCFIVQNNSGVGNPSWMVPILSFSLVCSLQLLRWSGLQSNGEVLQRPGPSWSMGLLWWVQQDWGNAATGGQRGWICRGFFLASQLLNDRVICIFYSLLHRVGTQWTKQKYPQQYKMPVLYTYASLS